MTDRLVRVVVSCADRKVTAAPPSLELRAYQRDLGERAKAWMARLERPATDRVPAASLYRGEHWSVAKRLTEAGTATQQAVRLSIASAGYGLLAPDELVESYAATFTPRQPDSITRSDSPSRPSSDGRFWWEQLATRDRQAHLPATLTELAGQDRASPLVVALSGTYTSALADDILGAAKELADPSLLFLVSAGSFEQRLESFLVPIDARFSHALGGTTLSLNVRVAKHLIEQVREHDWERSGVHHFLSAERSRLPDRHRYERRPLTDVEVTAFIRSNLEAEAPASRTALLRRLRDLDMACEQRRFGRLYQAVLERSTA